MGGSRRSGCDRREKTKEHPTEKRSSEERRKLLYDPFKVIGILEKIPIFKSLSIDQFKRIINICSNRNLTVNEVLCRAEDESYEMFILIKGLLKVVFSNGKELSRISPIGIVGEMGVFTNERRSASVVAASKCIILSINKRELFWLFRSDSDLGIRILMNVVNDMAHKLKKNNILIEELRQICPPNKYSKILSQVLMNPEE